MHSREPVPNGYDGIAGRYRLPTPVGEAMGPAQWTAKSSERDNSLSLLWNALTNLIGEAVSFLQKKLARGTREDLKILRDASAP